MRALVVYESIFGNTRLIADSIAAGLADRCEVDVAEISDAPRGQLDYGLIVVGGPTHVWGMSRGFSRRGARDQARQQGVEVVSKGDGIREWLTALVVSRDRVPMAVFDTAIAAKRWIPTGSAAKKAAIEVERKSYKLVADPEQFHVIDSHGPLVAGELERAWAWGHELFELVQAST
ncbi:MAG: flavodoxin family protein [Myxococcales bacterium FL481]|nr:MAG: flavodoxin family protein [Myxococcales bacterium FL481]